MGLGFFDRAASCVYHRAASFQWRTSNLQSEAPNTVGRQGSLKRGNTTSIGNGVAIDNSEPFAKARINCAELLNTKGFNLSMGAVILANTVTIGVEQSMRLQGGDTSVFELLEHGYIAIYIAELSLRFFAFRIACIRGDSWVRFDLALVIIAVLTNYVLVGAGHVSVLRTVRTLRLARAVRLFAKFRELWMLVRCLLNSWSTMLYTMFLLGIVLYIFSSVAIELITMDERARGPNFDPAFRSIVDEYFSTLPIAMLTLLQFVCMDDLSDIYKELILQDWRLTIFFIAAILIISIVLMNLVTAVVVNGALEQAYQDKEMVKRIQDEKQRTLLRDLREMLMRLDEDESGEISAEELQNVTEEDKSLLYTAISCGDPMEVFHALDVDNIGNIAIDEFLEGIYKVSVSKAPIEMKRVEKQVDAIREQLRRLETGLSTQYGATGFRLETPASVGRPIRSVSKDRSVSCSSYYKPDPDPGAACNKSGDTPAEPLAESPPSAPTVKDAGALAAATGLRPGDLQDALLESVRTIVREELRQALVFRSGLLPTAASATATVVITSGAAAAGGPPQCSTMDAIAARTLLEEMEALQRQLASTDGFMQSILQRPDFKLPPVQAAHIGAHAAGRQPFVKDDVPGGPDAGGVPPDSAQPKLLLPHPLQSPREASPSSPCVAAAKPR